MQVSHVLHRSIRVRRLRKSETASSYGFSQSQLISSVSVQEELHSFSCSKVGRL